MVQQTGLRRTVATGKSLTAGDRTSADSSTGRPGVGRRLSEAARLGFRHAIIPTGTDDPAPEGMTVFEAGDLATALRRAMFRPL